MKDKLDAQARLEHGLCHLPDRQPPADLQQRIMASLPGERETLLCRMGKWVSALLQERPGPVFAALSMAGLLLAFLGGMQVDRILQTSSPFPAGQQAAVNEDMNAEASFFLGRSLLTANQPEQALDAFRRAELLRPDNPKYILWQGAAYYALGDTDEERQRYQQVLLKRPDYQPARLNLANNLLQGGRIDQAGRLYEQILERDPTEKTAMYNQALVLRLQGKATAEVEAWKKYLRYYRTGTSAYRALQHLHELGDYSYRKYQLGYRTLILNQDLLLEPAGVDRDREINFLARQFVRQPLDELNIVVFMENDLLQAKRIARALRTAILHKVPQKYKKMIRVSWFGEPEVLATANQAAVQLPEGILIFSQPGSKQHKEQRI
ncbi:MAG: tetratricopeptide repeat protein [Desulfobulbaceae bacterium]|nr:tetratricopeptide repeat protein [Desulfobulbaceae bacterium]